jgi:hypothetical protein
MRSDRPTIHGGIGGSVIVPSEGMTAAVGSPPGGAVRSGRAGPLAGHPAGLPLVYARAEDG